MAEEVGSLRVSLDIDSANFTRSMTDINRKLRGLNSEFKANTAGNKSFEKSLEGLRVRSKYLNDTFSLQRQRVEQLRRQYNQSVEVKGRDAKETENLAIRYNKAVRAMKNTEDQLQKVDQKIEEQTDSWRQLGASMEKNGQRLQTVGRNLQGVGRSLSMYVTAPLVGAGAAALKVGIDFEESLSKVQAISQASGDEMESLEKQARSLATETRYGAQEIAEGMQYLSMAGFEVDETMKSMEGMLDLATAGAMDLGQAADITSNIMSAFSLEAEEAGRVSDVLAEAASSANTDVNQLGDAMSYLAPAANSLGWELEEATAAVMSLSDAGIQGSQAGSTFSTSLTRLANPTGKAAELISELEIEMFNAEGQMKAMPDVIKEFEDGMADMDEKTRAATLSTIVGQEAYKSWSVLLEEGSSALADNTEQLQGAEGAAASMAETMNDNTKGALMELKSNLEETGLILSETLLPVARDVTGTLKDWSQAFQDLNPNTQEFIIKTGGIAASTGPALVAIGGMANGVGALSKITGKLLPKLGGKAGLVATARMIPGPVGIAATAVTGLGAAAWGVNRALEKNKEVNLEAVETMNNEILTLDNQIGRWESLSNANNLTNDEMIRFMEIQKEMEAATNPEVLAQLKREADELQAKSGLSNDQLNEFIEVNKKIVEQTPGATGALTKYGDVLLNNTNQAKGFNDSLRESMRLKLNSELHDAEEQTTKNLEKQTRLMKEINEAVSSQEGLQENINEAKEDMEVKQQRVNELEEAGTREATKQLGFAKQQRDEAEKTYNTAVEELKHTEKSVAKKQEELALVMEELGITDQKLQRLIEIELEQANINAKHGEGIEAINEQISNLEMIRDNIVNNASESEKQTQKYKDSVSAIEDQIEELGGVRSTIIDLQNQSNTLNEALGADISKTITVTQKVKRQGYIAPEDTINGLLGNTPGYASGTDYHPGGMAVVGEEGPELINLPRGSQVFTNEETQRMLRETPREFASIGHMATSGLSAGLETGIKSVSMSMEKVMSSATDTAKQYDGSRVGKDVVKSIVAGIKEAESMSDVNITSLLSSGRESAWSGRSRSAIQKTRDIRDSNIRLLEQEISLLEQEGASQEDLNKAKEKQAELDALRSQKMQEYQNRIRDEQAILKELEKAYEDGDMIQSQYNKAVADVTSNVNDLRMRMNELNYTMGEEQRQALQNSQQALEEQQQALEEYAQEAADAFRRVSNEQMNAYDTAMDEELQALQDKTNKAIKEFNKETNAYLESLMEQEEATLESFDKQTESQERAINRQISNIERRRDAELSAIDEQLEKMKEEDKQRDREQQREAWGEERGSLQRRLEIADFMGDEATRKAVLQEIRDFEAEVSEQKREWERQDKRESLKAQKDQIKEEASQRIEEKKQELSDYQERRAQEREHLQLKFQQRMEAYQREREQRLEALQQRYKDEEEAFQEDYERQRERFAALSEQLALHVEEGKMTQEQANKAWLQAVEDLGNDQVMQEIENQEKSKAELNKYVDDYLNIGKSYGNNLIDGIADTLQSRLRDVRSIARKISSVAAGALGGVSLPSSDMSMNIPALADGGIVNRPTLSLIGEGSHDEAVLPLSDNAMSRLGSAIARNMPKQGGGHTTVQLVMDGRQVGDAVIDRFTGELQQEFRKG